jgi:hypothetical protein
LTLETAIERVRSDGRPKHPIPGPGIRVQRQ